MMTKYVRFIFKKGIDNSFQIWYNKDTTKEVVLMNKCKATLADLEKAYVKGLYIVQYSSIYQPMYSYNAGFYAKKVYSTQYHKGLVKRGTYKLMTAKEANQTIGLNLLR